MSLTSARHLYRSGNAESGTARLEEAVVALLRKIKPYVQAWYGTWHENMLDQPFYRVNSCT
jgi:hypothetical protein